MSNEKSNQIPREVRGVAKFLYTQNPFYLISACLVLYGLHISFGQSARDTFDPWTLAGVLCGYTLVMAATAVVLIRFGKVWDDARSIMLVLLFLFLAISVSFDEVCRTDWTTAAQVLVCALAFCVLVSEGVFRFSGIRFPILYRIPYFLFLSLFFLYPIWVSQPTAHTVSSWRILSFPMVASIVALTLIPAIRRGREYVGKNGTPWRWPLYPWTVFGFLAFSTCFRAFVLSLSFDPRPEIALFSAFGLYFLVPFLLVILALLLEIGLRENIRTLQNVALAAAPLLLFLAMPSAGKGNQTFTVFLSQFVDIFGSPTWLTMIGVSGFYLFAYLRGIRRAEVFLCGMLVIASFVGPRTFGWSTMGPFQSWPLAVAGLIQLVRAIRSGRSLAWFAAVACFACAAVCLAWDGGLRIFVLAAAYHGVMFAAIVISVLCPDRHSKLLRRLAVVLLAAAGLSAAVLGGQLGTLLGARFLYLGVMTCIGYLSFRAWNERWWLAAAGVNLFAAVGLAMTSSSEPLVRAVGPRAYYCLLTGLAFFVIAALISAQKCGVLLRVWRRLLDLREQSPAGPSPLPISKPSPGSD